MTERTEFEKIFRLPPKDDALAELEDDSLPVAAAEDPAPAPASVPADIAREIEECTDLVSKITAALPQAQGVEDSDPVFDQCVGKAMHVFDRLQQLMENVADNEVAPIVGAAKEMLKVALDAANAKAARNLNTVKLQLQQQRLDIEQQKVDMARSRMNREKAAPGVRETEGELAVVNRSQFLQSEASGVESGDEP